MEAQAQLIAALMRDGPADQQQPQHLPQPHQHPVILPRRGTNYQDMFFGDRELSDGILVCGDFRFHIHKMFLASRSEYFKGLFYSEFQERDQEEIKIGGDNANPDIYAIVLHMVYESSAPLPHTIAAGTPEWAQTILKIKAEMEYMDVYKTCVVTIDRILISKLDTPAERGVAFLIALNLGRDNVYRHIPASSEDIIFSFSVLADTDICFLPSMLMQMFSIMRETERPGNLYANSNYVYPSNMMNQLNQLMNAYQGQFVANINRGYRQQPQQQPVVAPQVGNMGHQHIGRVVAAAPALVPQNGGN